MDMDTTTTDMVRRRFVRTATTATLRMPALLTDTTVPPGSLAASSLAPVLGSAAATMVAGSMDVDIMDAASTAVEATMAEAITVEATTVVGM